MEKPRVLEADENQLQLDFTRHYRLIARKEIERGVKAIAKEAIRLGATPETVDMILVLLNGDNSQVKEVIEGMQD